MSAYNTGSGIGCYDCANADKWGRGCALGLMHPVAVALSGRSRCGDFWPKTTEQTEEQLTEKKAV